VTFSLEWDKKYTENRHISIWPWSDLISLTSGLLPPEINFKVLEIGFGMGANIPFFLSKGVKYYGIEGSKTAFDMVAKKFPELEKDLILGDFVKNKNYPQVFDMVVDRSSMTHNTSEAICEGLLNLNRVMKPNAKYIGIDWFSSDHSDFVKGVNVDANTKVFNENSCFSGLGNVHFSDHEHLLDIFDKTGFRLTKLIHKKNYTEIPSENYIFATWNFVAEKI
jgi:hypothetical protein